MNVEKLLSVAFLVPMSHPSDPKARWGLPVMLWGEPGIGKSERVETAAMKVGLPVRTTYIPTCQPEDAAGTAFMNTSKMSAFFESILFNVEQALDNAESFSQAKQLHNEREGWLTKAGDLLQAKFVRKMVKGLADVARRYGPSFARIEPLLPGVSDLMIDGQGVWFLDELSSGRPAVQAGFLGATLMRRVGGLQLPPGIRIVAAGNPPESAAGGWELEPPMANRYCHFDLSTPTVQEWSDWLLNRNEIQMDSIEYGEQRIREDWDKHAASVEGLISGFLQASPSLLHMMPAEGSRDRGRAWPSPRTWAFTAQTMTTCRCLGVDDDTQMKLIEGCIGEAAAIPLLTWIKNADLPHPEEMLRNGWKIDKTRLDKCFAVYTSMTAYILSQKNKEEQKKLATLGWIRLNEMVDAGLFDLIISFATALVKAGFDHARVPESQPILSKLAKLRVGAFVQAGRT